MRPGLRLFVLCAAFVCAIALVLLLDIRPALPELPSSLSSPVTLDLLRDLLGLVGWALAVALAGALLASSLRALFAPRPHQPPRALVADAVRTRRSHPLGQLRLAAGTAQAAFPPPFPLVLRSRPEVNLEPEPALPRPVLTSAAPHATPVERAVAGIAGEPRRPEPGPSIALLGPLKITAVNSRRRALRSQTQQLLAYLALCPDGAATGELIATLWLDVEEEEARKRLWRSASEARAHLGDVIVRTGDGYALDRDTIAIDVDQFEQLRVEAEREPDATDRERVLERALDLVRGQPLAGSDYAWAAGDTRRLRATIVELLDQLGRLRVEAGNPAGALTAAEQAITLDAYNEAAHRLAMRAEARLGLRNAIAERYERLRRELDERLGLEPERETRMLYQRLLSQDPSRE